MADADDAERDPSSERDRESEDRESEDRESEDRANDDAGDARAEDKDGTPDPERLQTELAVRREENQRLRAAYAAATRTRHRRTALGFLAVGVAAVAAGLLLVDAREVLFALGGTGLFAALLLYYLSPEQFVAASVGREVYAAMADNGSDVVAELGLADERIYVPTPAGGVRLFVPQRADDPLPAPESLSDTFVVPEDGTTRGVALRPTGGPLVEEYERAAAGVLADDPATLAEGLAEALVEQFEILDGVTVDVEDGRATIGASDSAFGPCTRFDHPVGSTLATGLARGLSEPVALSVIASADDRADWRITCRWDLDVDGE